MYMYIHLYCVYTVYLPAPNNSPCEGFSDFVLPVTRVGPICNKI